MKPDLSLCPICRRNAVTAELIDQRDYGVERDLEITCIYCGVFQMPWTRWKGYPAINEQKRFPLSRVSRIRNFNEPHKPIQIEKPEDANAFTQGIHAPENALEQLQSLLECIAELAPNLGFFPPDQSMEIWAALTMLPNADALSAVAEFAIERGLVEPNFKFKHFETAENGGSLRLTLAGWESLDKRTRRAPKKQAFVAMWFDTKMDTIWEKGYQPVLKELGWNPVRIDKEHFLNRIDDEIIQQINKSGLLIADATGERQGVYFEAGYAMGQEIPVIWTCDKSWEDRLHFDTRQYPHILWDSVEDLKRQLHNRLSALKLYHEKNGVEHTIEAARIG